MSFSGYQWLKWAIFISIISYGLTQDNITSAGSETNGQNQGMTIEMNVSSVVHSATEATDKGSSTSDRSTTLGYVSSSEIGDETSGQTLPTTSSLDATDTVFTTPDGITKESTDDGTDNAQTPTQIPPTTKSESPTTGIAENSTLSVPEEIVSMATAISTEAAELITNNNATVIADTSLEQTTLHSLENTTMVMDDKNASVTSDMLDDMTSSMTSEIPQDVTSPGLENGTTWGPDMTSVKDEASSTAGQMNLTTDIPSTVGQMNVTTDLPSTVGQTTEGNLCGTGVCENGANCTAGEDGSYLCHCVDGWTGTNCTEDIDECSTISTCDNGGSCINTIGSYVCFCNPGYTGQNCQTDIDECVGSPCQNNGSCVDGINGFSCNCTRYWTGDLCQEDVDECSPSIGACHAMAACTNTVGGFSCVCQQGYQGNGLSCDFVDFCESSPCVNGDCMSEKMSFTCLCQPGWEGENCTEDINECTTPSYGNCDAENEECVNVLGGHECRCKPGRTSDGLKCYRDTLYPIGNASIILRGDDVTTPLLPIPGGLPYGDRYYYIQVSMNGYATLGKDHLPPNPPIGGVGGATRLPILAPYWMDMDTTSGPGALYIDLYTLNNISHPVVSAINTDLETYVPEQSINVKYAMVATWKEVEPYPSYESDTGKENTTFQLVVASTLEETFVMYNYDPVGPWFSSDSPERRWIVAYTDRTGVNVEIDVGEDGTPQSLSTVGPPGRVFIDLGQKMEATGIDCIAWNMKERDNPTRLTQACPCLTAQARLDPTFTFNEDTMCATTKFVKDGQQQSCCYDREGALLTGYPWGGYPIIQDEETIRDTCCERNQLCHLFYEVRPSDDCQDYTPPSWGLIWGIGNVLTFSSEKYTFDGRGEFTLLTDPTFSLQGRMDMIPSVDSAFNATALVAVVAKGNGTSNVEIRWTDIGSGLQINVDSFNVGDLRTWNEAIPNVYDGVYLKRHDDTSLLVQFENGVGLIVGRDNDVLEMRVMADTSGGYYSGPLITNNDGTVPVSGSNSLFNYTIDGKSAAHFRFRDYVASDVRAIISDILNQKPAEGAPGGGEGAGGSGRLESDPCDGVFECLRDYVITGRNISRGLSTITQEVQMKEERRILENFPPKFGRESPMPSFLLVKADQTLSQDVGAVDGEEKRVVTLYNISTNISPMNYTLSKEGRFRWTARSWQPGKDEPYIQLRATDSQGGASLWWPFILYDACDSEGGRAIPYLELVPGMNSSLSRFYLAQCDCYPGYWGRFCSRTYNTCDPNPCFDSSADCTPLPGSDVPPGAQCTPCVDGLQGNGLKCYDVNECTRETDKCDQQCINLPGSYECRCAEGYLLHDDNTTCIDIDECSQETHTCQGADRYCKNTPGGYLCDCLPAFFMDNGTCTRGPKKFGGAIKCKAIVGSSGQIILWNDQLLNKDSPEYKQVADAAMQVINKAIGDTPGFVDAKVSQLSQGSIVTDYNVYFDDSAVVDGEMLGDRLDQYWRDQGCTDSGPDCLVAGLMGVSPSDSTIGAFDRCSVDGHCDNFSTECTNWADGTYSCKCRQGFQSIFNIDYICRDKNECESYNTCDQETAECINIPGSYRCDCKMGYRRHNGNCIPVCSQNPCLHHGECLPDGNVIERYRCRCRAEWKGTNCEFNNEAAKFRLVAIILGVVLGALCLILIIIIICVCIRKRTPKEGEDDMPYDDMHDKKINDRMNYVKRTYSTSSEVGLGGWENNAHQVAPAQHRRTTQFEMVENGSKQNLLDGGKYQLRKSEDPSRPNYAMGGHQANVEMGMENPSYTEAANDNGDNKLDTQYF